MAAVFAKTGAAAIAGLDVLPRNAVKLGFGPLPLRPPHRLGQKNLGVTLLAGAERQR
jgi:hypothetical protein